MGLAAAIGPPLGGWLTEHLGWSSVFWINAPVILLSAYLSRGLMTATPSEGGARPRFDLPGVALLTLCLLGAVSAVHSEGALRPVFAAVCISALTVFLVWERRAQEPMLDIRMFRHLRFSAGIGVTSIQNFGIYGVLFQVPYLLAEMHDIGSAVSGQLLLAMTGSMVLFSPVGGRLADRFSARLSALIGSLLGLTGTLALAASAPWASAPALMPWMLLIGAGIGFSTGPSQAAALSAIDAKDSGMASGAMSMFRYVGSVSVITLLGVLLALEGVSAEQRYQTGFLIYAGGFAITAALAMALPARGVAGET